MAQKMLIDATHAEETRVVVVDGNKVEEFDFETANRRQLAGNIYLAKITRVEPSLQAAFVDYGGNRHGFLAFSEIHPDYYQIPAADRAALLAEEQALASAQDEESTRPKVRRSSNRRGSARTDKAEASKAQASVRAERTVTADEVETREIPGMDIVDLEGDDDTLFDATDTNGRSDALAQADETRSQSGDATAEDSDESADTRPVSDPYVAADHASETDDQIESVADDDVSDELRPLRRPRMKRYKIQEVIKVRQIMLVQVVKEERGNKGAALTTYLSLAGRYCVLMPNTARGGGISRKITNAADRKKLKDIAGSIEVPRGAGLIIRTAGAKRTKAEIKRDYEYLFRLWEQIRELTLKSIAPAPIYEEGNLIKRSIRDLYSRNIDEVLVEGAEGYRVAKDFMKMIMPSHARNVKQYHDSMPLFARFQVETTLSGMFNPTVQLKSGGYIVIGVTEALVAIDVNSGKATKEGSIEETALKTNLEAAEEIARQLRLRDLAGLIVIDFIDMEERRNNAAVEKMLKDKLKSDRARIQVGRISGFGLQEMSRQRLRPGMLESTTQPCSHCHGTGLLRSDDSVALTILRQLEEEGTRKRSREVLVRAPVGIVNFLINQKREHIAQIEGRYGMAVRLEGDPLMVSPDYTIEKFKTATRVVEIAPVVVSVDMPPLDEDDDEDAFVDETEADEDVNETPAEVAETTKTEDEGDDASRSGKPKRRRRRRRRGGNGGGDDGQTASGDGSDNQGGEAAADAGDPVQKPAIAANGDAAVAADAASESEDKPARKPRRRGGRKSKPAQDAAPAVPAQPETVASAVEPAEAAATAAVAEPVAAVDEAADRAVAAGSEVGAPESVPEAVAPPAEASEGVALKPVTTEQPAPQALQPDAPAQEAPLAPAAADVQSPPDGVTDAAAQAEGAPVAPEPEPVAAEAVAESAPEAEPAAEATRKPRRRGWWNLGG